MRNDNAYLQSLLDKGGEVTIPAINPATGTNQYDIAEPLVLTSGTHVTLDGCVLRLCDGVYSNIFLSKGAWDEGSDELLTDISIVGKNGATLDGGEFNGLTEKTAYKDGRPGILNNTFILFVRVCGFRVSGLKFCRPRYWNVTFAYSSYGVIKDIEFDSANNAPNQDGIDLRVGCHDVLIENISGSTGDDTVALTGIFGRFETSIEVKWLSPDIYNVRIKNIDAEVTGGHGIVRLLCHDGVKLHDVEIADIYDRLIDTKRKQCIAAVRIGDVSYWHSRPATPDEMYNISIANLTTNARETIKRAFDMEGYSETNIKSI